MFIYVGTGVEKACLVTLLSKGTQIIRKTPKQEM